MFVVSANAVSKFPVTALRELLPNRDLSTAKVVWGEYINTLGTDV